MLTAMDQVVVSLHITRQAARIILRATDELVQHFMEEGILSSRDASHLFEVSAQDRKLVYGLASLPVRIIQSLDPSSSRNNSARIQPYIALSERASNRVANAVSIVNQSPPLLNAHAAQAPLHLDDPRGLSTPSATTEGVTVTTSIPLSQPDESGAFVTPDLVGKSATRIVLPPLLPKPDEAETRSKSPVVHGE